MKAPTPNTQHINDPKLTRAGRTSSTGSSTAEERKQTFKAMEELYSEEQYTLVTITVNNNFFADPSLRNAQIPYWMTNGSLPMLKYWWFEKA